MRRRRAFTSFIGLLGRFAIVLGSNIGPAVGFLHMLLAIALSFAFVRARMILAFVHGWSHGVFIIDMTVSLLFCWPSILRIFAARVIALPGPGVSLLVLGQVTRPLEFLVAFTTALALFHSGLFRLLAASHRMQEILISTVAA